MCQYRNVLRKTKIQMSVHLKSDVLNVKVREVVVLDVGREIDITFTSQCLRDDVCQRTSENKRSLPNRAISFVIWSHTLQVDHSTVLQ